GRIGIDAALEMARGALSGRELTQGRLGFAGVLQGGEISGKIDGGFYLDRERVELAADVASGQNGRRIENLELRAGVSRLSGSLASGEDALWRGALNLDSPDVSTIAALMLMQA